MVHRIVGSDEFFRYELAEDLTRHHHHHLDRSRCGEVQDFTAPASIESDLDRAPARRRPARFDADHHRLDSRHLRQLPLHPTAADDGARRQTLALAAVL